jgi:predicted RNA binding protein YcfA (HicA-like mRNA interferase family)
VTGSHHVFKHPGKPITIVLPHPKKDLGRGLVRNIYKQAGWAPD